MPRKQLQTKKITVKEKFREKVSKNPRDAMVRKLARKVESSKKPKIVFEISEFWNHICTRGRPLHKLFNDIGLNQIAQQKLIFNLC